MRPTVLVCALSLTLFNASNATAEEVAVVDVADGESTSVATSKLLDRIVVTATLTERPQDQVPNTVDLIDRAQLDRHLTESLGDLFRYVPGVSVTNQHERFGIGDIRIRGLGGNRVRIIADGVAIPDAFAIGSFSSANRDFVDLDTVERVEVLRGPGSALYGSDALGGVVSFRTRMPDDYVNTEHPHYADSKLGFDGAADERIVGSTLATTLGDWSALLTASTRSASETDNRGDVGGSGALRTRPNPQDKDADSVVAKLQYRIGDGQRVSLSVDANRRSVDTDMLSSLGLQPLTGATTTSLIGNDEQDRRRFAFVHEIDGDELGWADHLRWQIYGQRASTTQRTDERRTTAAGVPQLRHRQFDFDQDITGLDVTGTKALNVAGVLHELTAGVQATRTRTEQERNGSVTRLDTGAVSNVVSPDVFPVRDFPISAATTWAAFVQDELTLLDGALHLFPAIRADRYSLAPHADAIYRADNPGVEVVDRRTASVSPKFGAVVDLRPGWSVYANVARGFRSPPYGDVNVGFTNLQFGYTAIANPDLKPEHSRGIDVGSRLEGRFGNLGVALFDNRYRDFIESLRFVGRNDAGLMVFQSQNVSRARIKGAEASAALDLGAFGASVQGWTVRASAAMAHGDDETADRPLNSIDPARATVGLSYDEESWGAELAGTAARRQGRVSSDSLYRPAGYGIVDLFARWTPLASTQIRVGVFNLADRRYADWSDVAGVAANSPALDRYTHPGRTLTASLIFHW